MKEGIYVSNRFALGLIGVITVCLFLLFIPVIMSWMSNATEADLKADLQARGYTAFADADGDFDVPGDLDVTGDITAGGTFYGDGSGLTGVSTGSDTSFNNLTVVESLIIPITSTPTEISGSIYVDDSTHKLNIGHGEYSYNPGFIPGGLTQQLLINSQYVIGDAYPTDIIDIYLADCDHPHAMVYNNNTLYCGFLDGTYNLVMVPTDFSSITYYDMNTTNAIFDAIIADGALWLAEGTGYIYEVDLTDPSSYTKTQAFPSGKVEALVTKDDYLYCLGLNWARKYQLSTRSWAAAAVNHAGKEFHAAILEATSSTIFAAENTGNCFEFLDLNLATTGTVSYGVNANVSDNMAADGNGGLIASLETSESPSSITLDLANPIATTIVYDSPDFSLEGDSVYHHLAGMNAASYVQGTDSGLLLRGSYWEGVVPATIAGYYGLVPTAIVDSGIGLGLIEEIVSDGTYLYIATFDGSSNAHLLKIPISDIT